MARQVSIGFELQSATSGVEWYSGLGDSGSGGQTISTTTKRSGAAALRINPSSITTSYIDHTFSAVTQFYFRTYIYIASLPTADTKIVEFADETVPIEVVGLVLSTTGTVQALDVLSDTLIGSASSALSTNTWYRVEIFVNTATSTWHVTARINGTNFVDTNYSASSGGSLNGILLGALKRTAGNHSADLYFDDVALNDTTGSFQNSWPGDGSIIHLKPDSTGDANGFLTQVGGTAGSTNNYTRVDEVTPNDVTDYNGSALLNAEDLFNCEASGIGASDTVNVVAVGVRMADLVAADATAAFKLEIEKTSGGTKSQSNALAPNSTSWLTHINATARNYQLVTYQDPDSNNWTQSTLDSMQIGYIQTAVNLRTIAVTTVWALVESTPAPVNSSQGSFMTTNTKFW